MTILQEMIAELNTALDCYQSSREQILPPRADDIAEMKHVFGKISSAIGLRQYLEEKLDTLPVGKFSIFYWLDLLAFKKVLRLVLSQRKYSNLNLLIVENGQLLLSERQLRQELQALREQVAAGVLGNSQVVQMQQQISHLQKTVNQQASEYEQLNTEYMLLAEQAESLQRENHQLQQRAEQAEARAEQLFQKYLQQLNQAQSMPEKSLDQPEIKPLIQNIGRHQSINA